MCLHLPLPNSVDIYRNEKYFEQNYGANRNINLQLFIESRRSQRFIADIYSKLGSLHSIWAVSGVSDVSDASIFK